MDADLSQNITIDSTQEKTNTELINYLSSFMNDSTTEGKKNLEAFDTRLISMLFFQFPSLEEAGKNFKSLPDIPLRIPNGDLGDDVIRLINSFGGVVGVNFDDRQKEYISDPDKIKYFNNFQEITKDEDYKKRLNDFKNLYSFSEDFSKTKKFQDYYTVYQEQVSQVNKEVFKNSQDIKDYVGAESFITSEVVKNSYSKSEVIENYTNISDTLKELLIADKNDSNKNIGSTYVKKIEDTISLYENMVKDLEDMWGYGDLDINI